MKGHEKLVSYSIYQLFGVLKTHEDDIMIVAEKATPGGVNSLLSKSEKRVKFVVNSPDASSESEYSDDNAEERVFMVNNQKKFYEKNYNSGSKFSKYNKTTGSSDKEREGNNSEDKKELTGDSGYDCNYFNGKNHLAKDCMLKKKKERENVTKDEAYYVTKLENFRNLNVKDVNLVVANETDESMDIWSSGSDDEEMMRPTHGAMFARDAKVHD